MGKFLTPETAGVDGGTGRTGEVGRSGDKVGVDMGFQYRGDLHVVIFCPGDIGIDIATRVDNSYLSGGFIGDEVSDLGESRGIDAFDEHE